MLTAYDLASLRKFDDVVAISNHGYDIHNFEAPGNIKWAPMEINGEKKYVICNASGFGTTTMPPDGSPVVNFKGQGVDEAEFEAGGYYDIPLRCLIPEKLDGLMIAGRNLSSDIYAQSGSRLIMACFSMGEAAGTATALSLAKDIMPRELDRLDVQRELIANNVNIGQNMREIPGLGESNFNDEYRNPEFLDKEHKPANVADTVKFVKGR